MSLDLATPYDADAPQSLGAERFGELLGEKSDGEISVNFFPGAALGTETDNFNSVSHGELDVMLGGGLGIDMFASEFFFFQVPYMMRDLDHVEAFIQSDLHQQMVEKMDESNIHFLGHISRGARESTSNTPFTAPEEMAGIDFRLPEIPTWTAIWTEVGAGPTPVALPELYGALQTGVVNASEGPYEQMALASLQEVQDYLITTQHIFEMVQFWISKDLYDSLTDEQRQWVDEAAEEAIAFANEESERMESEYLQELQEGGMEVIEPDREAFREAARPALERLFEDQFVSSYEEIMQLAP